MKFSNWEIPKYNPFKIKQLQVQGIPTLSAAVLCARGIDTPEQVEQFFEAGEEKLLSGLQLRDLDLAVARIRLALEQGERIAVYGDYDVDGITATCLLTDYFRSLGADCIWYIPDRIEEGYGLNLGAIRSLAEQGVTLVVTVDCGITAVEEVEYAKRIGVDICITDHHECKEALPAAVAVVDPCRPDCAESFSELAGVGVALKLAIALALPEEREHVFYRYADIAAIGTVADVMTVLGENRTIVARGLEQLNRRPRLGIEALIREAGQEGKQIRSSAIGYILAPRINAAGRMGRAGVAVKLLLTRETAEAEELSRALCGLNRERQEVEGIICKEASARLKESKPDEVYAGVLSDENWHQGVVGIVASRLAEKYRRPCFLICTSNGKGKGSCRSYGGVNLFSALTFCEDLLESFGGHEFAAGFTVCEEQIPALRARLNEYVREHAEEQWEAKLPIDVPLPDPELLTEENVQALDRLEPHGTGNPEPIFALFGLVVRSCSDVGGGKHLKLTFTQNGRTLDGIFFGTTCKAQEISPGDKVDIAFRPQINEFRGRRSVQLLLVDLRPAIQTEKSLYDRYCEGEMLDAWEARALTPVREEFVSVWSRLSRMPDGVLEGPCETVLQELAGTDSTGEYTTDKSMICLDVFQERGLIALTRQDDFLHIHINPVFGKTDLEASPLMRRLRKFWDTTM